MKQVLYARIVSRSQLLEFMQWQHIQKSRESFNWRLRRMVDHRLVHMHTASAVCKEHLFTIGTVGLQSLERLGVFCPAAFAIPTIDPAPLNLVHALELNDIQLSLLRSRRLVAWTYELELRSSLQLGSNLYGKAYDAVVDLLLPDGSVTFALEFERTQKNAQEYHAIRQAIEADRYVQAVLYLVPSTVLASSVSRHFRGVQCPVYFGLVNEFKSSLLDAMVSTSGPEGSFPLHRALKEIRTKPLLHGLLTPF